MEQIPGVLNTSSASRALNSVQANSENLVALVVMTLKKERIENAEGKQHYSLR